MRAALTRHDALIEAIVTDTGGILSRCAFLAREDGIPAGVGTGHATAPGRDGQPLEVDGGAGPAWLR
jgi:pyruvate,water dikinase